MGVYYLGALCVFDAQMYAIFTSKIPINAQNQEEKWTSEQANEKKSNRLKWSEVWTHNFWIQMTDCYPLHYQGTG